MKVEYDPRCGYLARYFLEEVPDAGEEEVNELAGMIQLVIEGWFLDRGTETAHRKNT